jgi:hypothetical protein
MQHVRFLCYDALNGATKKSFDYDHHASDSADRKVPIQKWQEWWAQQTKEQWFLDGQQPPGADGSHLAQPPAGPIQGK